MSEMTVKAGFAPITVLGLMSGTSMDGIDLAVIETDGERVSAFGPTASAEYPDEARALLEQAVAQGAALPRGAGPDHPATKALEIGIWAEAGAAVTHAHAKAIADFAAANGAAFEAVSLVGFHGQTVLHRPDDRLTVQLGDGAALAKAVGRPVADAFRLADVAAGGQGAPFAPLYHRALAGSRRGGSGGPGGVGALALPVAVVNIGGVSNVTWIGAASSADEAPVLAFDSGPGNGPLDDWVRRCTGAAMDKDGALARGGTVHESILTQLIDHPYFDLDPPKSLDRLDFGIEAVRTLSPADGAATLTAFTAEAIRQASGHFPAPARTWIICGGGRRNPALMAALAQRLGAPVVPAEQAGWRGDDLEAEAFGFLAVRVMRGLPLSLPETTGVPMPCPGGVIHPVP